MARLQPPPSSVTGPLGAWLDSLWRVVDGQPRVSIASFAETPNSLVSGLTGDLLINYGSASTDSRLWLLGGATRSELTDRGWRVVQVRVP